MQGLQSGPQVPQRGGRGGEARGLRRGGKPTGVLAGSGRGVESPQGTDTPGLAELPWGNKTPGVTTAREVAPRVDGPEQGGDENPPTTRATRAQGDGGSDKKSMGGMRKAAPLRPHWGTEANDGSTGTLSRHTSGTDGTRLRTTR